MRGQDQIWHIDCDEGFSITASAGLPVDPGFTHFVCDIAVRHDLPNVDAWAIYNSESLAAGRLGGALYHTPDGNNWDRMTAAGLPGEALCALLLLPGGEYPVLYTATDSGVYVSTDGGDLWTPESHGLPGRPHCSDLFQAELGDGHNYLYLSTFGWSVWAAQIPTHRKFDRTKVLYHYPYLYPDDAPRPQAPLLHLAEVARPRLNVAQPKSGLRKETDKREA